MSSSIASEAKTVQFPLIKYASQIGWEIIPRETAEQLRGGTEGLLFSSVLKQKLIELNPGLTDSENVREIIRKIESVRFDIRGNKEALGWMRGEKSVFSEREKRELNVCVIDYENRGNNVFQVTDEWSVKGAKNTRRADIVFLINGIPVAVAETKSPVKREGISEGLTQIKQYHRETPAMLALPQLFEITNLPEFYYGATWNTEAKNLFNWKDEREGNFEKKVKEFFDREKFLKLLERWIVFFRSDDELKKTVLRQHQTRAAEKIENRCADPEKKRGLVWHTQGSGKTFTMIKAAELALKNAQKPGDPTVILIMDRNELEGQMSGWVSSLSSEGGLPGINIRRAETKNGLREILKSDFRGLVVSMIHKFDEMPGRISDRENIFVFVDEAHRSIGGDLGNYLAGALPNATIVGFTGTPVDQTAQGKGTFKIFGNEDKLGYLDKYSIMESISDGTTVELKYKLAPMGMRVPKETLEKEFLEMAEAEGLTDMENLNRVLDRAVTLKTFLKSNDRIAKVAEFAAKHFTENVAPLGYKAFFVAVDREACALYKEAFDARLDPETVKAVYTQSQHDSEKLPLVAKYQLTEDEEKNFRKQFRKADANPKLFIVTDKLLTGFDAPVLYCMYLDKPMRDHVLLQSIARVNRPYSFNWREKPCGLIVDFIGILNNMKKALAFDSADVSGIVEDIEILFESFQNRMKEAQKYLNAAKGGSDDKKIERLIEYFSDRKTRDRFLEFFRELQSLYEILSPDEKLRKFLDNYKNLCAVYEIVRERFGEEKLPVEYGEFQTKTEQLVRDKTGAYKKSGGAEIVVSEETLTQIMQSGKKDSVKVSNLLKLVEKLVEHLKNKLAPASIGGKMLNIKERYDSNQTAALKAVEELEGLARELLELKKRFEKSGKTPLRFVFMLALEKSGDAGAEKTAEEAENLFNRFPNYLENKNQERDIRSALYKIVRPAVGENAESAVVGELMKLHGRFKKEVQG